MRALIVTAILALGACSSSALVDAAYPDRARFAFLNTDQDSALHWACENGATAAETETRAKAAHQFLDTQIEAVAAENADRMIAAIEAGQSTIGIALETNRRLQSQVEVLVAQAEERFQCVMYEVVEL